MYGPNAVPRQILGAVTNVTVRVLTAFQLQVALIQDQQSNIKSGYPLQETQNAIKPICHNQNCNRTHRGQYSANE